MGSAQGETGPERSLKKSLRNDCSFKASLALSGRLLSDLVAAYNFDTRALRGAGGGRRLEVAGGRCGKGQLVELVEFALGVVEVGHGVGASGPVVATSVARRRCVRPGAGCPACAASTRRAHELFGHRQQHGARTGAVLFLPGFVFAVVAYGEPGLPSLVSPNWSPTPSRRRAGMTVVREGCGLPFSWRRYEHHVNIVTRVRVARRRRSLHPRRRPARARQGGSSAAQVPPALEALVGQPGAGFQGAPWARPTAWSRRVRLPAGHGVEFFQGSGRRRSSGDEGRHVMGQYHHGLAGRVFDGGLTGALVMAAGDDGGDGLRPAQDEAPIPGNQRTHQAATRPESC